MCLMLKPKRLIWLRDLMYGLLVLLRRFVVLPQRGVGQDDTKFSQRIWAEKEVATHESIMNFSGQERTWAEEEVATYEEDWWKEEVKMPKRSPEGLLVPFKKGIWHGQVFDLITRHYHCLQRTTLAKHVKTVSSAKTLRREMYIENDICCFLTIRMRSGSPSSSLIHWTAEDPVYQGAVFAEDSVKVIS